MNRLMLCSGGVRREGWQTLDCDPKFGPDYLASIPPLPAAIKQQRWNEIELIHGITSFYPWEAKPLLSELREVLAPSSGKLVLEQPNAHIVAQCVVGDPGCVRWFFGDPSFENPSHMNKWAYTPETLYALLRTVGFERIVQTDALHHEPTRDFRMEAYA
jgi:hypothetical protein